MLPESPGSRPRSGLCSAFALSFLVLARGPALPAPVTECVSIAAQPHPLQGNQPSWVPSISSDGRYVAFTSLASTLVRGDTNWDYDVFVRDRQEDTTSRVSVSSAGLQGNGSSHSACISGNGRYVAFVSGASNLVADDGNGVEDIFLHDLANNVTERVSVGIGGAPPNGYSHHPSISADGRYVAFQSRASNLVPGDTNGVTDIFVRDRVAGVTLRVSLSSTGAEANDASWLGVISADGTAVAFVSDATNLVEQDTNGQSDVFVRVLASNRTYRASIASDGSEADASSDGPSISADGSRVAFESAATNLVLGDTNDAMDVFLRDLRTRNTIRVSVATGGAEGHGHSTCASISADGATVAFRSEASDLVPDDLKDRADIFAHNVAKNETTRVSVGPGGAEAGDDSDTPSITADGSCIAFASRAANLVPDDTNGEWDVFLRDRAKETTSRVSVGFLCRHANENSNSPAVSANGRFVAFSSYASNLVPGDNEFTEDVFLRDRVTGATTRISIARDGGQPNGPCSTPAISADGTKVVFVSSASNLVDDDTNNTLDVFLYDTVTSRMHRVSLADKGHEPDGPSYHASVSADGRFVAFRSSATNLVVDDTNACDDVFVRDRQAGRTYRVSVSSSGEQGRLGSSSPAISADGEWIAFVSKSDNLVEGDRNGRDDVFLHNLLTGQTRLVSVASDGTQANQHCGSPAISGDGQYVAFASLATNLVPHDSNDRMDVFLRDVKAGETYRVSVSTSGQQATGDSGSMCVSSDGRYVAFASNAPNLVPGDTNGVTDVFVRDTWTSQTRRASVSSQGAEADGETFALTLSGDGRFVAFASAATNLAEDASLTFWNVYVRGVLSEPTPYTMGEAVAALSAAGGLSRPVDVDRLDVDQPAANRITLGDALLIARKVVGLSPNP